MLWRRLRRVALAGLDEAGLVGEHDRLDAVPELQFCQDASDVRFDGRFAEEQGGADFCVGTPLRDQAEDLQFPRTLVSRSFSAGSRCPE